VTSCNTIINIILSLSKMYYRPTECESVKKININTYESSYVTTVQSADD